MKKIFIDGRSGTTGLRIDERLALRNDIEILSIPEEKRKDPVLKKEFLNSADIVFLCLPDDAARESVAMIENPDVCVIDTSTAHRTDPNWAYGFPELGKEFLEKIKKSKRISVPGCHASGFIALIHPLVKYGFISPDTQLNCTSLTGYSGGGKNMIADYGSGERSHLLDFPRTYGLTQNHKHLKEMISICNLSTPPAFLPIVGDFYSGMEVIVPIFKKDLLKGNIEDIKYLYKDIYNTSLVTYSDDSENGFLSAGINEGTDKMTVGVFGNDERILLSSRYDNLGKGASGAAVECLNIVMGVDKTTSLIF